MYKTHSLINITSPSNTQKRDLINIVIYGGIKGRILFTKGHLKLKSCSLPNLAEINYEFRQELFDENIKKAVGSLDYIAIENLLQPPTILLKDELLRDIISTMIDKGFNQKGKKDAILVFRVLVQNIPKNKYPIMTAEIVKLLDYSMNKNGKTAFWPLKFYRS